MEKISRDYSIDYFKGLLVIGMVYTHVLQFFSDVSIFPSIFYSTQFFNLITFSGFVFSFGYVCQLAYYSKPLKQVYKKMFLTGLKTLLAFYVSGIAFQIFVEDQQLSIDTISSVVFLQLIPGWSEFLISFSLIILFGLLLFKVFVWLSYHSGILLGFSILLLFTTFIDYSLIHSTYLALFLGTLYFPTFPVIQYLPFYLLGIYFAKQRVRFQWKYLASSSIGTMIFLYILIINDFQLPSRFPPTIFWVLGSTFFLYIYYTTAILLNNWKRGTRILQVMGENVLFYLLISNLLIFSLDNALDLFIIGPWKGLLLTLFLLLVITYFVDIVAKRKPLKKVVWKGNGDG